MAYVVFPDNIDSFLGTFNGNGPVMVLPVYMDEDGDLGEIDYATNTIYDFLNCPKIMTGFEPRMIGTRSICTYNIVQIFSTVTSITWQVKDYGIFHKIIYWFTELSRIRKMNHERLQANACVYYSIDDKLLSIITFNTHTASGVGTTFTVNLPEPIITIESV